MEDLRYQAVFGSIPDSWSKMPLPYVASYTTGFTPPSDKAEFYGDEYPWANISDLDGKRTISETQNGITELALEKNPQKHPAPKGSLLFSFKLSIGNVAIAGKELYTNEAIAAFMPYSNLNIRFAYYAFPIFLPPFSQTNIYGAELLGGARFERAQVLLPPLSEQEIIADYLDEETAEIDATVAKLDELIEELDARFREKITEFMVGNEAQLRHYGELNPTTRGFDSLEIGEEITYMPLEAVHLPGREDYSQRKKWTGNPESYNRFKKGDILVPKVSPTFSHGRTMIADIETDLGLATSEVFVFRPHKNVDPRFARYLFHSRNFISEGTAAQNGVAGLQRVSSLWIEMYPVPLLSLEDQRRIADFLDAETARIDKTKATATELREELLARRKAIITEVVTGQKRVTNIGTMEVERMTQ